MTVLESCATYLPLPPSCCSWRRRPMGKLTEKLEAHGSISSL
jgi:hypothetical protein